MMIADLKVYGPMTVNAGSDQCAKERNFKGLPSQTGRENPTRPCFTVHTCCWSVFWPAWKTLSPAWTYRSQQCADQHIRSTNDPHKGSMPFDIRLAHLPLQPLDKPIHGNEQLGVGRSEKRGMLRMQAVVQRSHKLRIT